jgi:deoxyribodipyrimidine photo-lyase
LAKPSYYSELMTLQIIWFKRDLRLADHAVLTQAAQAGPVLPLFIVEPDYWQLPDVSRRQWLFLSGCAEELGREIAAQGGKLCVQIGESVAILEKLRQHFGDIALWSHEETGNDWTYARDRRVGTWARSHTVAWHELQQFGVWRGRNVSRDRWAAKWDAMMAKHWLPLPKNIGWVQYSYSDALPDADVLGLAPDGLRVGQTPGRKAGRAALQEFLFETGENYTREMSSPITAEHACSRVSPYISYGALSMREVYQAAQTRAQELQDWPPFARGNWSRAMRSFTARLHWHCHFIQKLETEPSIEYRPMAKVYENLRPEPDRDKLTAWKTGATGYPFIDAAMRYLIAKGWINFRMRAMLMSFASYDLWLPWQISGQHLAQMFVDYEPGIHWPQCQMQSGETGINMVRIYAPVKQGYDQDPSGDFVRLWVPELAHIKGAAVHEPWLLGAGHAPDYPKRIVDHKAAVAFAKDQIYNLRKQSDARMEAKAVQQKHGSRKRQNIGTKKEKTPAPQLTLDL